MAGKAKNQDVTFDQSALKFAVSAPRLSEDVVRRVRALVKEGYTKASVAQAFGITKSAVMSIVRGKTYKTVQ